MKSDNKEMKNIIIIKSVIKESIDNNIENFSKYLKHSLEIGLPNIGVECINENYQDSVKYIVKIRRGDYKKISGYKHTSSFYYNYINNIIYDALDEFGIIQDVNNVSPQYFDNRNNIMLYYSITTLDNCILITF